MSRIPYFVVDNAQTGVPENRKQTIPKCKSKDSDAQEGKLKVAGKPEKRSAVHGYGGGVMVRKGSLIMTTN